MRTSYFGGDFENLIDRLSFSKQKYKLKDTLITGKYL